MINYYLLIKPGIIFGNLITLAAGFLLASKGVFDFSLFFSVLLGLSLIMASACVFNNYIDRPIDRKMERTKNRPLVTGVISNYNAISFAIVLGLMGISVLYVTTNLLTVGVAFFGFLVYVILYSLWKSKTIYGTAIGSVAGAVPPVVGYCAVSNQLDLGALIFFTMMILWQMPHFFAIAIYRLADYTKAGIPVLPVMRGMQQTKIHMLLYILAFIGTASALTFFQYTGLIYLSAVLILGFCWLVLCLAGFKSQNEARWGQQMFQFSLVLVTLLCLIIPFDTITV
jgi:protoheme IX farnesyltransferase